MASAGDVNADGFDDLVVGASDYSASRGVAFVYVGSAQGLSPTPSWIAGTNQPGCFFGRSVGTAGEVEADGYDEVIVGAWDFAHGQSSEGAAFVYPGRP